MKQSDTPEKQIDTLIKTTSIMQKEKLFDVEFYAFLNAFLYLKMRNLEEDIKHAMEKWKLEEANQVTNPTDARINTDGSPITPNNIPFGINGGTDTTNLVGPNGPQPGGPSGVVAPAESEQDMRRRLAMEEARKREVEEQMRRLQEQELERQRRQAEEKAR
jgi:hypothetical protein